MLANVGRKVFLIVLLLLVSLGFLFRPTTLLAYGDDVDPFFQILQLIHVPVEALVGRQLIRAAPEELLVICDGWLDQFVLDGLILKNFVAGNELALDLLDLNHVSELDRFAGLTTLEQFSVFLEDAKELLVVGNFLAIEHTSLSLHDHLPAYGSKMLKLLDHVFDDVWFHVGVSNPSHP